MKKLLIQYSCNKCNYIAITKDSLHEHILSCQNEVECKCKQCGHKTNDREEYQKHMKVHEIQNESNGDKRKSNEINKQKYISKRIKFEKCERKFNKKETFQKHVLKIHGGIQSRISSQNMK